MFVQYRMPKELEIQVFQTLPIDVLYNLITRKSQNKTSYLYSIEAFFTHTSKEAPHYQDELISGWLLAMNHGEAEFNWINDDLNKWLLLFKRFIDGNIFTTTQKIRVSLFIHKILPREEQTLLNECTTAIKHNIYSARLDKSFYGETLESFSSEFSFSGLKALLSIFKSDFDYHRQKPNDLNSVRITANACLGMNTMASRVYSDEKALIMDTLYPSFQGIARKGGNSLIIDSLKKTMINYIARSPDAVNGYYYNSAIHLLRMADFQMFAEGVLLELLITCPYCPDSIKDSLEESLIQCESIYPQHIILLIKNRILLYKPGSLKAYTLWSRIEVELKSNDVEQIKRMILLINDISSHVPDNRLQSFFTTLINLAKSENNALRSQTYRALELLSGRCPVTMLSPLLDFLVNTLSDDKIEDKWKFHCFRIVTALAPKLTSYDSTVLQGIIAKLNDIHFCDDWSAICSLYTYCTPVDQLEPVFDTLIGKLKDPNEFIRSISIEAISRIAEKCPDNKLEVLFENLIAALQDEWTSVKKHACQSLISLAKRCDERQIECILASLIARLDEGGYVGEAVFNGIMQLLPDLNENQRKSVITRTRGNTFESLTIVYYANVVQSLVRHLDKPDVACVNTASSSCKY